AGDALAQTPSQKPAAQAPPQKAESAKPVSKAETRNSEPPNALVQLNAALEALAAKASPAVVQILVTGYGPLREEERSQTAFIVRQHAVGSGVIVDPDGYIMTNAHVVEGALRIRVVLAEPSIQLPGQLAAMGKAQVLDAKLVGIHREIDLALLKVVPKTPLPTLSLGSGRSVRQGQLVVA